MKQANSAATAQFSFPEAKMIPVNGIELEVFEAGSEHHGRPIVLCHGFPELAYSWRHQIPMLVEAGYHVIVPNQRGYGASTRPQAVEAYDIQHLTDDLASLLDHYGYEEAIFMGHDWGANVVWRMAQLHPTRVKHLINLALPYQARGERPWIEVMKQFLGDDFYFVHFNKFPGVADAILHEDCDRFLGNLFRKELPPIPPSGGMMMIELARAEQPMGEAIMPESELEVFIQAFRASGFTGAINWYRNLNRNWHLLADVDPIVHQPALMIYGDRDMIPRAENLSSFVPHVEVKSLDCGHWIQQERPEETNALILDWLRKQE